MTKIKNVSAMEVLDSRGVPTIKATIELVNGIKSSASIPSGASTGKFEAIEMRDGDKKRYEGKGVLKACKNINAKIAKEIKGENIFEQEKIDQIMIKIDGTENKSKLGANAILGVSLAVARAASLAKRESLYKYICSTFKFTKKYKMPVPMFNVINGGKHSDSGLDIQEFMIVPTGISKFSERMRAGSEVYHNLKKKLLNNRFTVSVGDEGGFAPKLENNTQALQILQEIIKDSGYQKKMSISIDVAASVFYDKNSEKYNFKAENVNLSSDQMIAMYDEWIRNYNILSIEDGLEEEAWEYWEKMQKKMSKEYKDVLLVGDDFLVTNIKRLEKAITAKSANTILIKLNQIGTLTETVNCIKLAQKAGWKVIVSHRSGETCDDFIADLAVGTNADYIKAGAPCRGERLAKYNRLLEIEEELN